MENLIGTTLTIVLVLIAIARDLTLRLNRGTGAFTIPTRHPVPQAGMVLLTLYASLIAGFAIFGALFLPLEGVYGPVTLVIAVLWQINARWKVRLLPWYAPVEAGLERGEMVLLSGGAIATLIGYLWTV